MMPIFRVCSEAKFEELKADTANQKREWRKNAVGQYWDEWVLLHVIILCGCKCVLVIHTRLCVIIH